MPMTETASHPAVMTLEEYLHTSFHPDCDFVDGVIEERNMGDKKHSLLQAELVFWFLLHRKEWNLRALPEFRTQVSATRYRLPDVSIAYDDAAMSENIRVSPPLIAIEVLSPEDRLPRVLARLGDFWKMGVAHVWLLDPLERAAFTYTEAGLKPVDGERIDVGGTPIYLDLAEVFAGLD